jgi:hypothetical protein
LRESKESEEQPSIHQNAVNNVEVDVSTRKNMSWELKLWGHFALYVHRYIIGIILVLIYLIIQVIRLTKHAKANIAKEVISSPEGATSSPEGARTTELIYEGLGWFAIVSILIALIYFDVIHW